MIPQEMEMVNKAILISVFLLGFIIGAALTLVINELKISRNRDLE